MVQPVKVLQRERKRIAQIFLDLIDAFCISVPGSCKKHHNTDLDYFKWKLNGGKDDGGGGGGGGGGKDGDTCSKCNKPKCRFGKKCKKKKGGCNFCHCGGKGGGGGGGGGNSGGGGGGGGKGCSGKTCGRQNCGGGKKCVPKSGSGKKRPAGGGSGGRGRGRGGGGRSGRGGRQSGKQSGKRQRR